MKAKLIKVLEHYHLYDGDKAIATTIIGNPMLLPNLSLKNCQAIELGYDLDELAKKKFYQSIDEYGYENWSEGKLIWAQKGFIEGAKTILEILGDKKFSELDLYRAFTTNSAGNEDTIRDRFYNILLPSLQQTEWDVIIKTTCDVMVTGLCCSEVCDCNIIPKLDADGCLICLQ